MSELSLKGLFKNARNQLEGEIRSNAAAEALRQCRRCGAQIPESEYVANLAVCPKCGFHHGICARQRIKSLVDEGSFSEMFAGIKTCDPIAFPGYEEKLLAAESASGESESVIAGTCLIGGAKCCLFVMVGEYMMGSMGIVAGDKIAALFEYALANRLPVVGVTVSGGARMQEGMFSLMQMAKVSLAVKRHSDAGLFYLAVLTNPTTGGVTASFAMQADVTVAEPGALIGFAGPRVIKQTIQQELPEGFQTAEYVLKCGFVDAVVPRAELKAYVADMLDLHGCGRR